MKEHVDDFRGIQTATVNVTEDYVRKFILCSLLGSKNVFTELFPDGGESDGSFEAIDPPKSDGSFEAIDSPKMNTKGNRKGGKGGKYWD